MTIPTPIDQDLPIAVARGVKETEFETFMGVISPWEREYLLLTV